MPKSSSSFFKPNTILLLLLTLSAGLIIYYLSSSSSSSSSSTTAVEIPETKDLHGNNKNKEEQPLPPPAATTDGPSDEHQSPPTTILGDPQQRSKNPTEQQHQRYVYNPENYIRGDHASRVDPNNYRRPKKYDRKKRTEDHIPASFHAENERKKWLDKKNQPTPSPDDYEAEENNNNNNNNNNEFTTTLSDGGGGAHHQQATTSSSPSGRKKSRRLDKFLLLESLPPSWMGLTNQMILYSELMMLALLSGREAVVLPPDNDENNNNNNKNDPLRFIDLAETEAAFTRLIINSDASHYFHKKSELHMRILTFEQFMNLPFYKKNEQLFLSKSKRGNMNKLKLPSRNLVLRDRAEARRQLMNSIAKVSQLPIIRLGRKASVLWHLPFLTPMYFYPHLTDAQMNAVTTNDEAQKLDDDLHAKLLQRNKESPARVFASAVQFPHPVRVKINQFIISHHFEDESARVKNNHEEGSSSTTTTTTIAVPFHLRIEPDIVGFAGGGENNKNTNSDFNPPSSEKLKQFLESCLLPKFMKRIYSSPSIMENSTLLRIDSSTDTYIFNQSSSEADEKSKKNKKKLIIKVILLTGSSLHPTLFKTVVSSFKNLQETLKKRHSSPSSPSSFLSVEIEVFSTSTGNLKSEDTKGIPKKKNLINSEDGDEKTDDQSKKANANTNNNKKPTDLFEAAVDAGIAEAVHADEIIIIGADYSTFTRAIQIKRCVELERSKGNSFTKFNSLLLYNNKLNRVKEVVVENDVANCYSSYSWKKGVAEMKKNMIVVKSKTKKKNKNGDKEEIAVIPEERELIEEEKNKFYFAEERSVLDNPYATVPHSYVPGYEKNKNNNDESMCGGVE